MFDDRLDNTADVFTTLYRNAAKTARERALERSLLRAGWAEKQDISTPRGFRQYGCGWAPKGKAGSVSIKRNKEKEYAYASGVQHCGYKSCPDCAAKLAEARRVEIQTAMKNHLASGGGLYVMLLTVPHTRKDRLKYLQNGNGKPKGILVGMQKAWTATTRTDRAFGKAKAHFGIQHWIRCEESPHTMNGWHTHYHVTLFTANELPETDQDILKEWFFSTWADKVQAAGMGECDRRGFGFEAVREPDALARYLSGSERPKKDRATALSLEMARGDLKKDRNAYLMGTRQPFEILADALEMDERQDWALFREYADAMYNHQTIRWSNGAKAALGVTEKSDEQILAEEKEHDEERTLEMDDLKTINQAHITGRPRHSGMDYLCERVGKYGMQEIDLFLDWQRTIQALERSP